MIRSSLLYDSEKKASERMKGPSVSSQQDQDTYKVEEGERMIASKMDASREMTHAASNNFSRCYSVTRTIVHA